MQWQFQDRKIEILLILQISKEPEFKPMPEAKENRKNKDKGLNEKNKAEEHESAPKSEW